MKFFKEEHRQSILVIGLIAFILRLGLQQVYGEDVLPSDGIDYHNVAVNLVLGHGYSNDTQDPHNPYFFREPGYPIFLSSIYFFYSLFDDVSYLNTHRNALDDHTEIRVVRFIQALIGACTCIVFFLTWLLVVNNRMALIIGITGALYVPLAVYSAFLMRETLQTFVIVCMNYFFARFLKDQNLRWIIAFAIMLGLSVLILRITVLAPFLVSVFLWVVYKNFKISLKYPLIVFGIMLLLISPWLVRTYLFYPDWRVLLSVGTSHTSKLRSYYLEMENALASDRIDSEEFNKFYTNWKSMSDRERFELSFSDEYKTLPAINDESESIAAKLSKVVQRWRLSWVESLWVARQMDGRVHLRPHAYYKAQHMSGWFVVSILAIVFGYMALPGLIVYFRKTYIILFSFVYFYSIFYFIANDPRRMLPVHLFVLGFSCLGLYYVYCRIRKISPNSIIQSDVRSVS